ncbi:hypothetical protein JCM11491_006606 [Sporobolomyces phaffii]
MSFAPPRRPLSPRSNSLAGPELYSRPGDGDGARGETKIWVIIGCVVVFVACGFALFAVVVVKRRRDRAARGGGLERLDSESIFDGINGPSADFVPWLTREAPPLPLRQTTNLSTLATMLARPEPCFRPEHGHGRAAQLSPEPEYARTSTKVTRLGEEATSTSDGDGDGGASPSAAVVGSDTPPPPPYTFHASGVGTGVTTAQAQ